MSVTRKARMISIPYFLSNSEKEREKSKILDRHEEKKFPTRDTLPKRSEQDCNQREWFP